jgi:hypothetical protein
VGNKLYNHIQPDTEDIVINDLAHQTGSAFVYNATVTFTDGTLPRMLGRKGL